MLVAMNKIVRPTVVVLALWLMTAPARAQEPSGIERLIESAEYWQERGRDDMAIDVWQRILASDPNNVRALSEICRHEIRRDDKERAEKCLERLERINPDAPELTTLRRRAALGPEYQALLDEARQLARDKQTADAIEKYREAFGERPPTGRLGVEFYTTLAGTEDGFEEARSGLERIAINNPDEPRFALAYARHLTYREATRRDGIAALRELARNPAVRDEALASYKQALLWLHAAPGDLPLYEAYLEEAGPDSEIDKKIESIKKSAPRPVILSPGERALRQGDLAGAEEAFKKQLARRPRDIDARLGLSQVAMQQSRFADAKRYLDEAEAISPRSARRWRDLRASAEFWLLHEEAEELRAEGSLSRAAGLLEQAAERSPREAHHTLAPLGHIALAQNRRADARAHYEAALAADPNDTGALAGMVQLLIDEERHAEAAEMNARLSRAQAEEALSESALEAAKLKAHAAAARRAGELDHAVALLQRARERAPDDISLLHELVATHLLRDAPEEARQELERLRELAPERADLPLLEAKVLAAEGRLDEALAATRALAVTGEPEAPPDFKTRRRRLLMSLEADRILRDAREFGDNPRSELERLERRAGGDPELLGIVALAWSDIGEHGRAQRTLQRALSASEGREIPLKLQLAAVLLRAGRLADLLRVLDEIEFSGVPLHGRERESLNDLRIAYAVRAADIAREQGDINRALAYLRRPAEQFPEDGRLLRATGRLLMETGDHEAALQIFERRLEADPRDFEARTNAVRAALALRHHDRAQRLVNEGHAVAEHSPEAKLLAARYHRARGDDRAALKVLDEAEAVLASDHRAPPPPPDDTGRADIAAAGDGDVLQRAFQLISRRDPSPVTPLPATVSDEIRAEAASIRAGYSEDVALMPSLRYRNGVAGHGRLLDFDLPLTASVPTGYVGRLRLTARGVFLDAGALRVTRPTVGDRFGQVGTTDRIAPDNRPIDQTAAGVGLGLSWIFRGLTLAVGSSPLGFPLQTFIGGAQWGGSFGDLGLFVGAGRRLVTESLLSYSGAIDPLTGAAWGQVTANGGRLDLSYGRGKMMGYVFFGFDWLLGTHVLDNQKYHGGAGLRWTLHEQGGLTVQSGVSFGMFGYRHNLRHFTWGHGGYFSPQLFAGGSVPLLLEGEYDKLSFRVEGDLGINWFREDQVAYYPTARRLMNERANLGQADAESPLTEHHGQESLGLGANLTAALAYHIAPRVTVGLRLRAHHAADYTELYGGLFVGYSFRANSRPVIPNLPPLSF